MPVCASRETRECAEEIGESSEGSKMPSVEWDAEDMVCEVGDGDAARGSFAHTEQRAPLEVGVAAAEISAGQLVEMVEDAVSEAAGADGAGAVVVGAVDYDEMGGMVEGGDGAGGDAGAAEVVQKSSKRVRNRCRNFRTGGQCAEGDACRYHHGK